MKPHYSLAEAFQRGLLKTGPPKAEETVDYYIHIYPEIDTEELIRRAALENIQAEDGSFNYGDPRVAGSSLRLVCFAGLLQRSDQRDLTPSRARSGH